MEEQNQPGGNIDQEYSEKRQVIVKFIRKTVPIVWKVSPSMLIITIKLRILQALVPIAQLYLTALLVNRVTQVIANGIEEMPGALLILLIQLGLLLASSGFRLLDAYVMEVLSFRTQYFFDCLVAEKASNISLIEFESSNYFDHLSRAGGHSDRALGLVDNVFSITQNIITIVGYLVVLISFHWGLALGLFILIIPSLIAHVKAGHWRFNQMVHQTSSERKASYLLDLISSREAAKELRVFRLREYLTQRWDKIFWKNTNEKLGLEKKTQWYFYAVDAIGYIIMFLTATFLIWLGSLGRVTIGHYVALIQAIEQVHDTLENIAYLLALIYQDALFASTLFTFLELPVEKQESKSYKPLPTPLKEGITINKLSFSYPTNANKTLEDISFHVRPGEKVVIVGENGSGKTTLVKCLLGLYPIDQGTIYFDRTDLTDIDPIDLRNHITAVFQDFVQYQLTGLENIGVGRTEKMKDKQAIFTAAKKTGADEFLSHLKNGYETELGPYFFEGQELSQGQWQKVAISRAFFRDSEIIVLDEPTASLDPLAEGALFNRFIDLTEGKTSFFISHRLGSCRNADRVLVLKNGRLVENGHHDELMQLNGVYAQMFREQAKWYSNMEQVKEEGQSAFIS